MELVGLVEHLEELQPTDDGEVEVEGLEEMEVLLYYSAKTLHQLGQ